MVHCNQHICTVTDLIYDLSNLFRRIRNDSVRKILLIPAFDVRCYHACDARLYIIALNDCICIRQRIHIRIIHISANQRILILRDNTLQNSRLLLPASC